MIYLLDVNVLIALLDARHVHNEPAHRWVRSLGRPLQWATCPLVENAFVRITSSPAYPNSIGSATTALRSLKKNCAETDHRFWPDDISLRDDTIWNGTGLVHSSQITDCYLLALAAKNGARLASFDRKIPAQLIRSGVKALHFIPV